MSGETVQFFLLVVDLDMWLNNVGRDEDSPSYLSVCYKASFALALGWIKNTELTF